MSAKRTAKVFVWGDGKEYYAILDQPIDGQQLLRSDNGKTWFLLESRFIRTFSANIGGEALAWTTWTYDDPHRATSDDVHFTDGFLSSSAGMFVQDRRAKPIDDTKIVRLPR